MVTDIYADLSLAAIRRGDGDAAIGVDVGGTKTALGLVDAAGLGLLASTVIPTGPERGGAAVLADIRAAAADLAGLAGRQGRRVTGLGLAVPEIVSPAGVITSAAVIPDWNDLPVARLLGRIAPVRVEADVRAAAFAEAVLGAGRGHEYLVYLTVGTGISYCAVYQGRPLAGARGGALNVGTTVLAVLPGACPEPGELILEHVASGSALARRYADRSGRPAAAGAAGVLSAAAGGDPDARAVLAQGAQALGLAIALLVNLLDPEAVITGGGLGSADTPYWADASACARRYLHPHAAGTVLARAALGPDAGVIGAGLVGLQAARPARSQSSGTHSPAEESGKHRPEKEVVQGGS
jgi:glucokinase